MIRIQTVTLVCPFFPLILNLIIDELIVKWKKLGIGIKLGDNLVSVMAFVDDLDLVTELQLKSVRDFSTKKVYR